MGPRTSKKHHGGRPAHELPADLLQRIRQAGGRQLREIVSEHVRGFSLREVRHVLLNPHVHSETIDEIALVRSLTTGYEVRCALARHPKTAEQTALRFVGGLYWRDLLEVTLDVRIRSSVRHAAESHLLQKLPRLAEGEKITLARRAPIRVQLQLREDESPRVVAALLQNQRLTEEVVVGLAAASRSPRILAVVADNERWGPRYEVRAALARNDACPFRAVLDILPGLNREDLEGIAFDARQSTLIRNRAEELLAERRDPVPPGHVWQIDPLPEVE